jgi:hypothetical protein
MLLQKAKSVWEEPAFRVACAIRLNLSDFTTPPYPWLKKPLVLRNAGICLMAWEMGTLPLAGRGIERCPSRSERDQGGTGQSGIAMQGDLQQMQHQSKTGSDYMLQNSGADPNGREPDLSRLTDEEFGRILEIMDLAKERPPRRPDQLA